VLIVATATTREVRAFGRNAIWRWFGDVDQPCVDDATSGSGLLNLNVLARERERHQRHPTFGTGKSGSPIHEFFNAHSLSLWLVPASLGYDRSSFE
jgi:hypothetical protein